MAQPVFLITDGFMYGMLIATAFLTFLNVRKTHLRKIWAKVFRSKLAVGSATVILVFLGIALLDSIHFKEDYNYQSETQKSTSVEIVSVLDLIFSPLNTTYEKSYVAPFALYSYGKYNSLISNGKSSWEYEPLNYVNKSVQMNPSSHLKNIFRIILQSISMTLLCWGVIWGCYKLLYSYIVIGKFNLNGQFKKGNYFPHHFFLIFLFCLILIIVVGFELSRDYHIFGTTKIGEDVFYQAIKSIRTGVLIGTMTTLLMVPFAVIFGISAGYYGGWIDDVIQYIYTTLSSIPGVLLIAASILSLEIFFTNHPSFFSSIDQQADIRLLALCVILGITNWTDLCRLLRAETLKVREYDYIMAAKALGVGSPRIMIKHILPNVMHIIIITMVLNFSGLVLAEAVLSYVGVGVDPNMFSWGNMINAARLELARSPIVWWPLLTAFIFMFSLVLSANIFSEKVREAFDPRSR